MSGLINVGNPSGPPPLPFDPATIDEVDRQLAGPDRREPRRSGNPQADRRRAFGADTVEMLLYVSGNSLNCGRAAVALQQTLREFPSHAVRVRVVDVLHDIDGATRDRVLFTPTLIFTDQLQRKTRVLGDLSNGRVLWDLLTAAGLEPI